MKNVVCEVVGVSFVKNRLLGLRGAHLSSAGRTPTAPSADRWSTLLEGEWRLMLNEQISKTVLRLRVVWLTLLGKKA